MPITEIATLHLNPPYTLLSPPVHPLLLRALELLSEASTQPFSIYLSVNDPLNFYLFGHWDSLEHHHDWLISDANKKLLVDLTDKLQVESMYHVDTAHETLPLGPKAIVTVARFWLTAEQKATWKGWGRGGWAVESEQGCQWVGWREGDCKDDVKNVGKGVEKTVFNVVQEIRGDMEGVVVE